MFKNQTPKSIFISEYNKIYFDKKEGVLLLNIYLFIFFVSDGCQVYEPIILLLNFGGRQVCN